MDTSKPLNLIGRGLGLGDKGAPVKRLQELLGGIGYGLEISGTYDAETESVIRAFQRHWVQKRLTGQADLETLRLIMSVKQLKDEADG